MNLTLYNYLLLVCNNILYNNLAYSVKSFITANPTSSSPMIFCRPQPSLSRAFLCLEKISELRLQKNPLLDRTELTNSLSWYF